jgi:hypothetical protein
MHGWRTTSVGKVNVELDDLLRWENEGGHIENRVSDGEASVSQGYSINLERSLEKCQYIRLETPWSIGSLEAERSLQLMIKDYRASLVSIM